MRFAAGERIGRVRITAGNAARGGNQPNGIDLVAMEDFIYAEPIRSAAAIPEPATLLWVGPLLIWLSAANCSWSRAGVAAAVALQPRQAFE